MYGGSGNLSSSAADFAVLIRRAESFRGDPRPDHGLNPVVLSMPREGAKHPFTIFPHVVAKLGFIHQVVTTAAAEHTAVKEN
jgi:hypothetical protein